MPLEAVSTVQDRQYPRWARAVRKEQPPASMDEYLREWERFFDHHAESIRKWRRRNAGYHAAIASLACFHIPPGSRVLEVGTGPGDLLAATRPSYGVGIDISAAMVRIAAANHPGLRFVQMAAEKLDLGNEKFDYIILSDMVGFLYDIRLAFERLREVCHAHTRIVINWYSRLWQPVLSGCERLGLKYPQPILNWTTCEDIRNLLYLTGFEIVQERKQILAPKRLPVLSKFLNRFIAPLPVVRHLSLTNWTVARPVGLPAPAPPSVSVICPCRNESGNIQGIVERLPSLGSHTELIFVEGHSKDDTLDRCRQAAGFEQAAGRSIKVLEQQGRGKGDAVRLGFSHAQGDVLMILDADVSVAPEDLVFFYDALATGKGDFINGCRLVYTMDPRAMRFLNLLGNRFFALLLSKLMGQHIKDSLCGTKVLWRRDYEAIARGRTYFGHFDPFGDFDLLFGAAKLGLKIVEIPVRYRQRTYGSTNISRFADGWLLLRMSAKAALKLFFVA